MKFTSSGLTHSAAMIRSPSFSRSSSSMITVILPRRRSSRMSSMLLNAAMYASAFGFRHQSCKIARHHVDFDVDLIARAKLAQGRDGLRVRDDIDVKVPAVDVIDGQTHAVDAD